MVNICPECQAGKCGNCLGDALDEVNDQIVRCQCPTLWHVPAEALIGELVRRGTLTRYEIPDDPEGTWHYATVGFCSR